MIGSLRVPFGILLIAFLWVPSCAPVPLIEDLGDYQGAIEDLQQQAARNPDDPQPLRDLGIIHLRTNAYAEADDFLQGALSRDPDDPKTLYHLGLAKEALGEPEAAGQLYGRYSEFSRLNPFRRLMAGRYAATTRRLMREAVQARVADEAGLAAETAEPRVVAVYPLVYQGSDDQYAALGRGLAELVTIDLGHVDELQLVERVRLQELIDEIDVAQSAHFDPATAPRVGRLIGAGRLVGGVYDVLGGSDLQLGAALWETGRAEIADLGTSAGALGNIMQLEKELVFRVIDEMGIEPTEEQRRRIELIPTQNLQAFLAFSRGLEREDAGAFGEAAGFFEQALQLDPNFRAAQDRADETSGLTAAAGPVSTGLAVAYQQDPTPPVAGLPGLDPMGSRLLNLNANVGSSLVPGIDAREPAVESGTTSTDLPDPPPPPGGGGGE